MTSRAVSAVIMLTLLAVLSGYGPSSARADGASEVPGVHEKPGRVPAAKKALPHKKGKQKTKNSRSRKSKNKKRKQKKKKSHKRTHSTKKSRSRKSARKSARHSVKKSRSTRKRPPIHQKPLTAAPSRPANPEPIAAKSPDKPYATAPAVAPTPDRAHLIDVREHPSEVHLDFDDPTSN